MERLWREILARNYSAYGHVVIIKMEKAAILERKKKFSKPPKHCAGDFNSPT